MVATRVGRHTVQSSAMLRAFAAPQPSLQAALSAVWQAGRLLSSGQGRRHPEAQPTPAGSAVTPETKFTPNTANPRARRLTPVRQTFVQFPLLFALVACSKMR